MGTRDTPSTPYRKGLAAGRAFFDAHQQWLQAGGFKSGQPKPTRPECPYRKDQLRARRGWQAGIDIAVQRAEQLKRTRGKGLSFSFTTAGGK